MKNGIYIFSLYCFVIFMVFFSTAQTLFAKTLSLQNNNAPITENNTDLTIYECIEIALKNNPNLQSVGIEKNIAKNDLEIAESERWPKFALKGGISRYVNEQRLIPTRYNGEQGVFAKNMSDIGVTVRMPLFVGGRIVHAVHAAQLDEDAYAHRLLRSREELKFNVISTFYTILSQEHRLKSIEFASDVLNEDRKRIMALMDAKKAAPVDLMRINVRQAQVQQEEIQVRNEMEVAYRILYNLMGLETDTHGGIPRIKGHLLPLEPMPETENAWQDALLQRPDYLKLQAQIEAQMARVDAVRGTRWPSMYIEGGYGYRVAGEVTDNPQDLDSSEDVGSIGLRLEMALFEGGRIQAQIRRELEKASALRQQLRALRLGIQQEVETAIYSMESSRRRIETQEAAIAKGREVLRIEQEKYRLGKGTILDVLDSQRALLDVETAYYQALAEYHIATHRFRLARGDVS